MPNENPHTNSLADILSGGASSAAEENIDPKTNEGGAPPNFTVNSVDEQFPEKGQGLSYDGYSLASQMSQLEYHPVMLFGTRSAGKSILLSSLFSYANRDADSIGSVTLGEPIIPVSSAKGKETDTLARFFFDKTTLDFSDGEAPSRTDRGTRIYLPIKLSPKDREEDEKYAFLESSGEDYTPKDTLPTYFEELKPEILDLYNNYPGGLSIIMVAPFVLGAVGEEMESDRGLYSALQHYSRQRNQTYMHFDRILFVLSKWDEHTAPSDTKNFIQPPREVIEEIFSQRFPTSWGMFQNIKRVKEKVTMVYSAGIMKDRTILKIPQNYRQIMSVFPHKLWSWIRSGHAKRRKSNLNLGMSIPSRLSLFDAIKKIFG